MLCSQNTSVKEWLTCRSSVNSSMVQWWDAICEIGPFIKFPLWIPWSDVCGIMNKASTKYSMEKNHRVGCSTARCTEVTTCLQSQNLNAMQSVGCISKKHGGSVLYCRDLIYILINRVSWSCNPIDEACQYILDCILPTIKFGGWRIVILIVFQGFCLALSFSEINSWWCCTLRTFGQFYAPDYVGTVWESSFSAPTQLSTIHVALKPLH